MPAKRCGKFWFIHSPSLHQVSVNSGLDYKDPHPHMMGVRGTGKDAGKYKMKGVKDTGKDFFFNVKYQ